MGKIRTVAILALIVSMTMLPVIRAQEDEEDNLAVEDEELDAPPQDQTRGTRMDRETIEMIMSSVSESCKQEMSSALAGPKEISETCKQEIQQALSRGAPANDYDDSAGEDISDDIALQSGGLSPALTIFGFLFAAFGAAAAYIYHVNKLLAERDSGKKKKKKKKKKGESWSIAD